MAVTVRTGGLRKGFSRCSTTLKMPAPAMLTFSDVYGRSIDTITEANPESEALRQEMFEWAGQAGLL